MKDSSIGILTDRSLVKMLHPSVPTSGPVWYSVEEHPHKKKVFKQGPGSTVYSANSEQVFDTKDFNTASHRKTKTFQQSKWFNDDCRAAKREFKTARNIFLRAKNDDN